MHVYVKSIIHFNDLRKKIKKNKKIISLANKLYVFIFWGIFMFTVTKKTFPKISFSLSDKKLLYIFSLYIINNYLIK